MTYSLNFLIAGLLKPGCMLTTSMEHNAVKAIEEAKNRGIEVSIADCNDKGEIRPLPFRIFDSIKYKSSCNTAWI